MAFHLYKRGSATGTFAQNVPFFTPALSADLRNLFNGIWTVAILPTTTSSFEYSTDGGVTFFPLTTTPLPASQETICNFLAEGTDLFQLRCPDVAGCTLFRVVISLAPQDIQRRLGAGGAAGDVTIIAPLPLPVDICPVTCDVPVINGSVTPLDVNVTNTTGQPVGATIVNLTNAAVTGNTNIFAALSPTGTSVGDSVMFRILWCAIDGGILRFTLNDSDFCAFNDQNALKEDSAHLFDVVVDHDDDFTLQFEKSTTVTFLRVIQLI